LLSPKVVRWVAVVICFAIGIPGMIVSSIADNNNGAAVTFGLLAAAAAVVLIVVTAVTAGRPSERTAEELEQRIQTLVEAGADERSVRDLVRAAIRFGRGSGPDA
jgi:hypothetical protein